MENKISFNNEELKNLSEKLSKFGDSLSEKERGVLNLVLARASGEDKFQSGKATAKFSDNKDVLINLANAIEGKVAPKPEGTWYFSWTYNF